MTTELDDLIKQSIVEMELSSDSIDLKLTKLIDVVKEVERMRCAKMCYELAEYYKKYTLKEYSEYLVGAAAICGDKILGVENPFPYVRELPPL